MQPTPDLYAVLGVAASATHAEVQAAYRRIMRDSHPDVAGTDPAAAERAVAANSAWALLKNPSKRALYDRERAAAGGPSSPPGSAAGSTDIPSWGPGGARPVTAQQLRDAAAAASAYSTQRSATRDAFSAASLRIGIAILLIGLVVLAFVAVT